MNEPTIIFSHNNAMFKLALSLNKQKFRKRHSLFLIEGIRGILQAKENKIYELQTTSYPHLQRRWV